MKELFKSELHDNRSKFISSIQILDEEKDNIILKSDALEEKITLKQEELNKIKELLNNDRLYTEDEVIFAPIMDGNNNTIFFTNNIRIKHIQEPNLYYWQTNNPLEYNSGSKEDKEYTKAIIDLINDIESILKANKIKVSILR